MNLQELLKQLAAGEITQEQFDSKVEELGLTEDYSKHKEEEEKKSKEEEEKKGLSEEEVQKMIQAAEDRIRTKYVQEKKDLEKKYDELKNQNLTAEEKLKLREDEMKEKEMAFERKELDFQTLSMLSKKKLGDEFLPFVSGSTIEERTKNLDGLLGIIDTHVETRLKKEFESQSREIDKGNSNVDFNKMTIDEQIKYLSENPDKANSLLGL